MKTKISMLLLIGLLLAVGVASQPATDNSYKIGWMDGHMAAFIESVGIDEFHKCLHDTKASDWECWEQQIQSATRSWEQWNKLTAAEKIKRFDDPQSHRWIDNLTGKGPSEDMPRYIR